ncbi:DEAD/DEAH box helicase family protein [Collinsella sp. TF10-11AT]|uniref:DEAD/DEAH box helicase family protein n=1 Tax=Collinsella sp. TF10-11AT TaxID=2292335 RepID=UPI0018F14B5D|nr:DEAD/DEAH box helicase family protein [Collinsella sp. TF10-11AT]
MQFKFKIQPYQTEAARAVTDVFAGQPNSGASPYLRDLGRAADGDGTEALPGFETQVQASEGYANAPIALGSATLLENIHKVQRRNRIVESSSLATGPAPVNLDVEMETGTGKTYVYTKTMLELNRLYGWTKFIIVVPSVAIREGVYKSLKNTEQHFFEQYGKAIRYFVYNSARLGDIDRFSASSDINVMVINMQAFNTSMKEGGRSKEARIMYSERDEFASRRPIDVIAANNPIVILDEPQKMGGNATQAGIARFRPIACLNYSATHKVTHDAVYVLDALDAFNQRLVKRIEVKGFELKNMRGTDGYLYLQDIKISKNKPPRRSSSSRNSTPRGPSPNVRRASTSRTTSIPRPASSRRTATGSPCPRSSRTAMFSWATSSSSTASSSAAATFTAILPIATCAECRSARPSKAIWRRRRRCSRAASSACRSSLSTRSPSTVSTMMTARRAWASTAESLRRSTRAPSTSTAAGSRTLTPRSMRVSGRRAVAIWNGCAASMHMRPIRDTSPLTRGVVA